MRSISQAINHEMLADRISKALALLSQFRSEASVSNLDQAAAIDHLFLQSDDFAKYCAQTVASAKGLAGLCLHPGCWHPVCSLPNCCLPACSLNHGADILALSYQKEDQNLLQSIISLTDRVTDLLMPYPEFAELQSELQSTRYNHFKLLSQFTASESSAERPWSIWRP